MAFEFGHGPGAELAEAEVGAAELNGVEVEDHVELVAAVVDEVVGLGKRGAGGFADGHVVVLRKHLAIHLVKVLGEVGAIGVGVRRRFELFGGEVGHAGGL